MFDESSSTFSTSHADGATADLVPDAESSVPSPWEVHSVTLVGLAEE